MQTNTLLIMTVIDLSLLNELLCFNWQSLKATRSEACVLYIIHHKDHTHVLT